MVLTLSARYLKVIRDELSSSYHISSHPIPSHPIQSHPIPSHPIQSNPIRPVSSHLIPSHPIPFAPSHPISSHLISPHPVPSPPLPSHPIPSHPTPPTVRNRLLGPTPPPSRGVYVCLSVCLLPAGCGTDRPARPPDQGGSGENGGPVAAAAAAAAPFGSGAGQAGSQSVVERRSVCAGPWSVVRPVCGPLVRAV